MQLNEVISLYSLYISTITFLTVPVYWWKFYIFYVLISFDVFNQASVYSFRKAISAFYMLSKLSDDRNI